MSITIDAPSLSRQDTVFPTILDTLISKNKLSISIPSKSLSSQIINSPMSSNPHHTNIISDVITELSDDIQTLQLDNSTILTYIIKCVKIISKYDNLDCNQKQKLIIRIIDKIIELSPIDPIAKKLLEDVVILLYPSISILIDHVENGLFDFFNKVKNIVDDIVDDDIEPEVENCCKKITNYFFN